MEFILKKRHILHSAVACTLLAISSLAAADTSPPEEKGQLISEVRAQCDDSKTAILQSTYVNARIMTITVQSGNKYTLGAVGESTIIRTFQASGATNVEPLADSKTWLERIKPESPNYYAHSYELATDCAVIPSQ